jgi:hypothetical protein
MGAAEIISFEEVRARKQWDTLRQALHTRFDEWLDRLEIQLPGAAPTLAQVTETMWNLRQYAFRLSKHNACDHAF